MLLSPGDGRIRSGSGTCSTGSVFGRDIIDLSQVALAVVEAEGVGWKEKRWKRAPAWSREHREWFSDVWNKSSAEVRDRLGTIGDGLRD